MVIPLGAGIMSPQPLPAWGTGEYGFQQRPKHDRSVGVAAGSSTLTPLIRSTNRAGTRPALTDRPAHSPPPAGPRFAPSSAVGGRLAPGTHQCPVHDNTRRPPCGRADASVRVVGPGQRQPYGFADRSRPAPRSQSGRCGSHRPDRSATVDRGGGAELGTADDSRISRAGRPRLEGGEHLYQHRKPPGLRRPAHG
jgi:hypothetical protein